MLTKSLYAAALLLGTAGAAWAQDVPSQGGTCRGQQVGAQGICSLGPITFSGNCGAGPYSNERDVAVELGSPEAQPVYVQSVDAAVIVSGDAQVPAIFIGDSDDPDPVSGYVFAQLSSTNGQYYAHAEHTFSAGYGMLWMPGPTMQPQGSPWRADLQHHIDVHVTCSAGSGYVGALTVWYYSVLR